MAQSNQPKKYDAVLGGTNSTPIQGAVLGGINGIQKCLDSPVVEVRIAALSKALHYGDVGLDLVLKALQDESRQVRSSAYYLLKNRPEPKVQQQLNSLRSNQIEYYPNSQIDSPIKTLHPELEQAAYIKEENPSKRLLNVFLNQPLVIDEYKLEIVLVETGYLAEGEELTQDALYVDLELNFSEREFYNGTRHDPGNTGYSPNPFNYPDLRVANLLPYAQRIYRTHRLCTGEIRREIWQNGLEIIELAGGYRNYVGRSRFYEQCLLDGSFDFYYEEYCDYGRIRFLKNQLRYLSECGIRVLEIQEQTAQLEISYTRGTRYEAINYEPIPLSRNLKD